ncbi:MAG: glycosyltransferase family 4 protein [Candidatus Contendobacter sp.]|nr:glycosyltransferase family 4 protein [Candidatus Contendobacter sp.]
MQNKKPIILTFVRYYLPGYKAGGPIRTIANMVDQIGDHFDFKIIAMDRDFGDAEPYPNITVDAWNRVGKAEVFYVKPGLLWLNRLVKLISTTPHDILYLNSAFNPIFTLWPLLNRRLGWIPSRPVIIAPRGEFSEGALVFKQWKKTLFIMVAKILNFYQNVIWHASSDYEKNDILRVMGCHSKNIFIVENPSKVITAPDLPSQKKNMVMDANLTRQKNQLRVVFLSRISPKKNLDFALRVFKYVAAPVDFNIYGPREDPSYWRQCESLIAALPDFIRVTYRGEVPHSEVAGIMAAHDLFFLPTRGENYGHVIAEALSAGTPVLIADTTAWRNLEQAGVGWDLPLGAEQPYAERIDYCAGLNVAAYQDWRDRVRCFAKQRLIDPQIVEANRKLFIDAANLV